MTTPLNGKKIYASGRFFGIGNTTNPTPMRPLLPQDMGVTFKREVKNIFGENQLPADGSNGTMTVNGKVTFGTMSPRLYSDLLFSDSPALDAQILEADNELVTVTSHVATVANSGLWTVDLGVVNPATGARFSRVAAASEVAGVSYSVAAGVYTFNATETATSVKISYLYAPSPTTGPVVYENLTMANQKQGKTGVFTSVMVFPWQNQAGTVEQDVLTLNVCLLSDHEISTKQSDYGKPTLSFAAFCDSSENLGTFSFGEGA